MNHTGYPYEYLTEIRFRDVDAMGHLNNSVYFTFMESARINYFAELLQITTLQDTGIILGETTCRYLSPAVYGEWVAVGQAVSRFGNKSFAMEYEFRAVNGAGETGRKLAIGNATVVGFDYATQASIPLSDTLKEKIRQQQPEWPINE